MDEDTASFTEWHYNALSLVGRAVCLDSKGFLGAVGQVYAFNEANQTFIIDTIMLLTPCNSDLLTVSHEDLLTMLLPEGYTVVEWPVPSPRSHTGFLPRIKDDEEFEARVLAAFPQPLARPASSSIPIASLSDGHDALVLPLGLAGQSHSGAALGRVATLLEWKKGATQFIYRSGVIDFAEKNNLKALESNKVPELKALCAKFNLSDKGIKPMMVARLMDFGRPAYREYLQQQHQPIRTDIKIGEKISERAII